MSHRRGDTKEIREAAVKLGYSLEGQTTKRHLKWRHQSGILVITISTAPTDRHRQNAISELRKHARRAGYPT